MQRYIAGGTGFVSKVPTYLDAFRLSLLVFIKSLQSPRPHLCSPHTRELDVMLAMHPAG